MAGRIRTIKPEILEDEEASTLSSDAWRTWISMWTLADDFGNLHASPAKLQGQVFWARPPTVPMNEIIGELVAARRIDVYRVNGAWYAHIRNWDKHQRIDNAGKNRVPKPEEADKIEEFAAVRGEIPQLSAVRGLTTTSDLRPPTTDHRPFYVQPSADVGLVLVPSEPSKPKKQKREQKPPSPEHLAATEICEYYKNAWLLAFAPADGIPPTITTPDFMQARRWAKKYGLEACLAFVARYIADRKRHYLDTGHALRLMPVDAYRANNSATSTRGALPARDPVAVSGERKL